MHMKTFKLLEENGFLIEMVIYDTGNLPGLRATEVVIDGSSSKTNWIKCILTMVPPYTKASLRAMIYGWLIGVDGDLVNHTDEVTKRFLTNLPVSADSVEPTPPGDPN